MVTAIEEFRSEQNRYPASLYQLNADTLNSTLHKTYQMSRFSYQLTDDSYRLEILIPFFDRWTWDHNEQSFVYDDF